MNKIVLTVVAILTAGMAAGSVLAEGNLASRPETLELTLNSNLTMTLRQGGELLPTYEYTLETGKYYRWEITMAAVGEELAIAAPALWRNSWVDQVVIEDLEIHMFGAPYQFEFDDEGLIQVRFVPIRPGDYEFYAPGHEVRGMVGKFIVR